MSTTGTADLFRSVRRLELVARRNAAGRLQGDYVTSFKGSGLLFEEPRRYVAGDPVRSIDWNITARVGEPHVRVHHEERQREVLLVLDVSPSMHVGFKRRTKLEMAVELAATLAVSAIGAGDRLGHLTFADRVLDSSRPRSGRSQLWRVLRALVEQTAPWSRPVALSDPRTAIHQLETRRRGRQVIFLISDFLDRDVPDDLRYLRPRHDVSLIHVYDPFELARREHLSLPARSPEGRGRPDFLPRADGTGLGALRNRLALACARLGITSVSTSTAEPVKAALSQLFRRKRRLRAA